MAGGRAEAQGGAPVASSKRLGVIGLALVGAILSVNLIVLLFALDERQRATTAAAREDAVWAAYQVDREAPSCTRRCCVSTANRSASTR